LEGSNGSGLDGLKNAAGCLDNTAAESVLEQTAAQLRSTLQEGAQGSNGHAPCNDPNNGSADCFINFDVQAIVLQIDKTLLNVNSNSVLGVWASTNSAQ
jgi:hypothetical protein